MPGYIFTREAAQDLDGIVDYTRRLWGDAQARRYMAQMRECLGKIAGKSGRFRMDATFSHPVRVMRCQHHYIYCLPREDEPALILAILHEKMDLVARMAERLG